MTELLMVASIGSRFHRSLPLLLEAIASVGARGADVSVIAEFNANKPDGFHRETVRTVTEKTKQLKVDPGTGFEGE